MTETHGRLQSRRRTENSQLAHWLLVWREIDGHGDQGVTAVGLAESVELSHEARPLQKGLQKKRQTGLSAGNAPEGFLCSPAWAWVPEKWLCWTPAVAQGLTTPQGNCHTATRNQQDCHPIPGTNVGLPARCSQTGASPRHDGNNKREKGWTCEVSERYRHCGASSALSTHQASQAPAGSRSLCSLPPALPRGYYM